MSPLLIHELRVMSPRNLVGVVHLPFLRSIINGDITLMYIFYIFISKEKTWVFHAFRATPSSTESHSFHHLEPHNPLIRAVYTPSVVRCICRILSSIDFANWRCFFVRDLKRILELTFENFCFHYINKRNIDVVTRFISDFAYDGKWYVCSAPSVYL